MEGSSNYYIILLLSRLKWHKEHAILLNSHENDYGLYHIVSEWVTFYVIRAKVKYTKCKIKYASMSFKLYIMEVYIKSNKLLWIIFKSHIKSLLIKGKHDLQVSSNS